MPKGGISVETPSLDHRAASPRARASIACAPRVRNGGRARKTVPHPLPSRRTEQAYLPFSFPLALSGALIMKFKR